MSEKFDNTGEDLEDLISIGTIGLIKAIESFSPNKGTKLATFAARCNENEILMHLCSLKKTRKDVSLHDPIGTDKEGNEITLIDILGSEADDVVDAVQGKSVAIYRRMSRKQREPFVFQAMSRRERGISKTGVEIMDIFGRLNQQRWTIIVITLDRQVAEQAKQVVRFRDGRLVALRKVLGCSPTVQWPR
nr:sigma factor [Paenibacillus ferrarius]